MSTPLDGFWQQVCNVIPSKHLKGQQTYELFGYRKRLAEIASQRAARGEPTRYLEVGVRLGHSLAIVALAAAEELELAVGVDLFIDGYGGEPNPGTLEVFDSLEDLGVDVARKVALERGDSHVVLPGMLDGSMRYNLILVDGDHTEDGAERDLLDAFKLLEPGGIMVFDDAVYRGDRILLNVWRSFIDDLHGDGRMIDAHEELDDEPGWCWVRRAP